jgi:flagellar FliL protein
MSEAPNKTATPAENELSAAPRSSFKRIAISAVLFLLVVGGGSVWLLRQHDSPAEAAQAEDSSSAPKYIAHLDGFTVNLADPEDSHFLRVTIDLGIDHLPPGADKEKASSAIPVARIRDSILSVLTVCKADVLLTPEGKAQLKKNLLEALNRSVPELGVREIYFTEFLVQR